MPDRPLPPGMTPRGLSTEAAAAYCGISTNLLASEVEAGRCPPPIRIRTRKVWLRDQLDVYLDRLRGSDVEPTPIVRPKWGSAGGSRGTAVR